MSILASDVRIVKVQVRLERIGPDGLFHCDVNPLHEQAAWMSIVGQRVQIALCDECKKQFEQAVVQENQ
jgi:hypothetical protein